MAKSYAPTNLVQKSVQAKPTKRKEEGSAFTSISLPFGKKKERIEPEIYENTYVDENEVDVDEPVYFTQKKIEPVVQEERKRGAFGYSRLRAKDLEDPRATVISREALKKMINEVSPREHVAWALCGLFASVFGLLICFLANKDKASLRTFMVDAACGVAVSIIFWTVVYCLFISVVVNALLGFPSVSF